MENLKIKQLQKSDLNQVIDLQKEIRKNDQNQEKLLNSPEKVLDSYFKEKGFILGIFDENELIGFSRVWFPEKDEIHPSYKEVLRLTDKQMGCTAFFRGSCIKKEYRGKKLQKKLFHTAIEILEYLGFQYATAKIKITNLASLKNITDIGFKNEGLILKDNVEYCLLLKKI